MRHCLFVFAIGCAGGGNDDLATGETGADAGGPLVGTWDVYLAEYNLVYRMELGLTSEDCILRPKFGDGGYPLDCTYTDDGNIFTFEEDNPYCYGIGTYSYELVPGTEVTFTLEEEECPGRADVFENTWRWILF